MIYTALTDKAFVEVLAAYDGKKDIYGLPYIHHAIFMAEQMCDEASTVTALLHGILSCEGYTSERLREEYPSEVCDALELLNYDGGDYFEYIRSLRKSLIAQRVKLAEIYHDTDLLRIGRAPTDADLSEKEKFKTARDMIISFGAEAHDGKKKARPIKHFCTITKHRHKVVLHCFRAGIGFQGLFHDLSKYSPSEFISSAKNYLGTRSPNEREREMYGYSTVWMHHKGRNKHHFEYWSDLNMKMRRYEPVPMPLRYLTEMFCDRIAASKIYQGEKYTDRSALEYFIKGNARKKMHPDTADMLESWLVMLAERGEDETFAYVKSLNKQDRKNRRRNKKRNKK